MRIIRNAVLVILVLAGSSSAILAQQVAGNLVGRVSDSSGAVIPGVNVTLKSPAIQGQQTVATDEAGNYRFLSLPPGTFSLTFELPGFKTLIRSDIAVDVGKTITINPGLEVATAAETVTVTGESPVVDVTSATVGINFDKAALNSVLGDRDQWSVLAATPGIRMNGVDVGGSHMGLSIGYNADGMSGQSTQTVDGVYLTCFYNDYGAVAEMQVSAAANSAETMTPGASVNTVLKTGGNQLHGEVYLDHESHSMQSTNLTTALQNQGITVGNTFDHYHDYNINAGGPFKKDKLWWFTSYRDNYSGIRTQVLQNDGTPGGLSYLYINNLILKMNFQANSSNQLAMTLQYNNKHQPVRNSELATAYLYNLASTYDEEGPFWIANGVWTHTINKQATFEVSANNWGYHIVYKPNVTETRRIDKTTGLIRGGDPTHTLYLQNMWDIHANLSYFTPAFAGGSHSMKFGYGWRDNGDRQQSYGPVGDPGTPGEVILYYRNNFATPDSFTTYDSPYSTRPSLRQGWLFAQDKWQFGRRVTVNLGARFDRQLNYYAAGGNPGIGPFSVANQFSRTNINVFNNIVPRLGVVFDIFGNTKTALKLNYGRFTELSGISSSAVPGLGITKTYTWDGTFPITPAVAARSTLLSQTGQSKPVTVDPNMRAAYTDEYSIGIDHELLPNFGLHTGFVRKIEHYALGTINQALPTSVFAPVAAIDPGPDGIIGSSDDRSITVFEQTIPTATDNYLSSFPFGNNFASFQFSATKRMTQKWQMLTGFDWTKRNLQQSITYDPNTLVWGGKTHTTLWTYKVLGTYVFPKGIQFSANLQMQKGDPYGRTINVTAANLVGRTTALRQGTLTLQMEPSGTHNLPVLPLQNLRVEKTFKIFETTRMTGALDIFNMWNANTIIGVDSLSGPPVVVNGNNIQKFGRPTSILQPRILRVGMRYTF